MITYNTLAGTVDVSVVVRIVDSTDGTPETAVVFNTAGIDIWYRRELAASVDITEATLAALTTAHADGGFLHINDGYYRVDLPDAACASGVSGVLIGGTVTGMIVIGCYINLTPVPVDVRQWLGTAAATPTVAGVPEVDVTHLVGVSQSATDLKDFADDGYDPSTNKVQGVVLTDTLTTYTGNTAQTGDSYARIGATGSGLTTLATQASVNTVDDFLDTEVAAIKAKTDLIPGTIDGKTFSELVTLIAAVLLGKASGLATTTAVFRSVDDGKDRVTATVDADGNRSAVTLDAA